MQAVDTEFDALRAEFEMDRDVRFWGQVHTIRPRVVSEMFGDGRHLIGLTTTDARPAYWIIRVDSAWNVDTDATGDLLFDHLDEIYDAIEDEFGCAECGCCGARYGAVEYAGKDESGETIWRSAGCDECRDEPEEEGLFPRFRVADGVSWFLIRRLAGEGEGADAND